MREPNLNLILQQLRRELAAILGDELDSVLLYGSQARGDADADSDIKDVRNTRSTRRREFCFHHKCPP